MALSHGMDVSQVQSSAGKIKQFASELGEIQQAANNQVNTMHENWKGPDSDNYANEWQSQSKAFSNAISMLNHMAQKADQEAQQQVSTSAT